MTEFRKALTVSAWLCGSFLAGTAVAEDVQEATLSGGRGAIDQYQVSCPEGTDHLKIQASRSLAPQASLLQNLKVAKGGNVANSAPVTPGMTQEVSLDGGKGKYSITIDTSGSTGSSKQSYSAGFQCLNAAGQAVKTSLTSSAGNLKKKGKKLTVNCGKTKTGGDPKSLLVQLTNITKGTPVLIAQVTNFSNSRFSDNRPVAVSVPESFPGELTGFDPGDYQVLVAHNGTPAPADFQYVLRSSCLDSSDVEAGTPVVTLLQSSSP
ncbi:hypothetical protein [Methyloterricola oryzae]|uniref:hypothetical protein n=1 Tax=Methyloterricola oryzae TaxID=1495050 RepID=UPI0005EB3081|nr:hypothetical protein [Methyloterricola oryzae]